MRKVKAICASLQGVEIRHFVLKIIAIINVIVTIITFPVDFTSSFKRKVTYISFQA